jgi:hypothetical protein
MDICSGVLYITFSLGGATTSEWSPRLLLLLFLSPRVLLLMEASTATAPKSKRADTSRRLCRAGRLRQRVELLLR